MNKVVDGVGLPNGGKYGLLLIMEEQQEKPEIIHDFDGTSNKASSDSSSIPKKKEAPMNINKPPIALFVILLVLGIGTGFLVAKLKGSSMVATIGSNGKIQTQAIQKGQTFGSKDEKTFKDSTEGILKEGGIEGEGAFHLERPGGVSQNVYLTSSAVDLSAFVGKKVKVWGETNAAQKAGWLMDVGRLQLL